MKTTNIGFDSFEGGCYDRYASESVFLTVNYVWSKGDDTPVVLNAGSTVISGYETEELRKKISESDFGAVLPTLIKNFLLEGAAYYSVHNGRVSVYSPQCVITRRNDCGEISQVGIEDCVTVGELKKMIDTKRFPNTMQALARRYDLKSNIDLSCEIQIVRYASESLSGVSCLFTEEGDEILEKYSQYSHVIVTRWEGHPVDIKTYDKNPILWAEYPMKNSRGEPIKPGRESKDASRRLEHARFLLHEAVHMTARPPMLFINDSMSEMGELDVCPDGITVLDTGIGGGSATGDIRKLYDLANASQILMAYVETLERTVKDSYGISGLNPPAAGTPEENVVIQSARHMRMKIIADVIRKKILDPILYEISGLDKKEWKIIYQSAAESDGGARELQRYSAFMSMAANLAAFDPSVADILDPAELLRNAAVALGIPDDNLRDPREVAEITARRRLEEFNAK